jgi:hypothetical protein
MGNGLPPGINQLLSAEHFGDDKNEHRSSQTAAEQEVDQGKTDGTKHGRYHQGEHNHMFFVFRTAFCQFIAGQLNGVVSFGSLE